jgi:uncharacterized membrane protein
MNSIKLSRGIALLGHFGLILTLALWFGVLAPSELFGPWLALFWIAPLLLPLPGLLLGHSYTYAWNSMLLLLYLTLGITEAMSTPQERSLAYAVLLCTAVTFVASQLYVRGKGSLARPKPVANDPD